MNAEKLVEVVLEAYRAGKSEGMHEGYELCRDRLQKQESETPEEVETFDDGYDRGYDVGYADAEREITAPPATAEYDKGYDAGYEDGLAETSEEADAAAEEEIGKLKELIQYMAAAIDSWPAGLEERYEKLMD